MRYLPMLVAAVAVTFVPAAAMAQTNDGTSGAGTAGEIGYAQGALGYDAMVGGDYQAAIAQIESNDTTPSTDPARLINLGQAYAKTGQTAKARTLLLAAVNAPESFDLVLANGQVANSRQVAKIALSRLNDRLAAR